MTVAELLKNIEDMKSTYDFDVEHTGIKVSVDMRSNRSVIELYTIDHDNDIAVRLVRSVKGETSGSYTG